MSERTQLPVESTEVALQYRPALPSEEVVTAPPNPPTQVNRPPIDGRRRIHALQRTIGNQAVQRALSNPSHVRTPSMLHGSCGQDSPPRIQRALTTVNLSGNYAAATAMFESTLKSVNDPIYALTEQRPDAFALRVQAEPQPQGKGDLGDTTIRLKATSAIIYGQGVDTISSLTSEQINQHGLSITIILYVPANQRTVGDILQTLNHEYGGHAHKFFPYVTPLLSQTTQQQGLTTLNQDRINPLSNLSSISHHYALATGQSGAYNQLRFALENKLFGVGHDLVMDDFYNAEERDREGLLTSSLINFSGLYLADALPRADAERIIPSIETTIAHKGYLVPQNYRQQRRQQVLTPPPLINIPLTHPNPPLPTLEPHPIGLGPNQQIPPEWDKL